MSIVFTWFVNMNMFFTWFNLYEAVFGTNRSNEDDFYVISINWIQFWRELEFMSIIFTWFIEMSTIFTCFISMSMVFTCFIEIRTVFTLFVSMKMIFTWFIDMNMVFTWFVKNEYDLFQNPTIWSTYSQKTIRMMQYFSKIIIFEADFVQNGIFWSRKWREMTYMKLILSCIFQMKQKMDKKEFVLRV